MDISLHMIPMQADYNYIVVSHRLTEIFYHLLFTNKTVLQIHVHLGIFRMCGCESLLCSSTLSLINPNNNSYLQSTGDLFFIDLHHTCLKWYSTINISLQLWADNFKLINVLNPLKARRLILLYNWENTKQPSNRNIGQQDISNPYFKQ